jgi:hypothetical protein
VLDWLASLGRSAIIEWIPKEDPMVQRLLASREDIFDGYSTAEFERAIKERFDVKQQHSLADSVRTLYLLERK